MIKRILVALDPDNDTPVATQYAISLAKSKKASLTGLAIVDVSNIYPTGITGGLDATHHARNLWEELSEETKKTAENLLRRFKSESEKEGVRHTAIRMEGASFERIIEGMKYHDLLIAGRDSHFFYNEPKMETKTLAKVVKHGVSPTLVVTSNYQDVKRVVIAVDGSSPSARSMKSFVQLMNPDSSLPIDLLYVDSEKGESDKPLVLNYVQEYLAEHGYTNVTKNVRKGNKPSNEILTFQEESGADLIVLGAHSVSALRRMTFGSTTHDLITKTNTPLFMSP
ncbi:MAG: universal stress protein [Balneolaceae bacterium]